MSRRAMNVMVTVSLVCLLLAAVAGCSCKARVTGTYLPVVVGEAVSGQARTVLWFTSPEGAAVPVTRDLPAGRARVWTAIEALCAGPAADSGLRPSIPTGTHLRKVVHWPQDEPEITAVDLDFDDMLTNLDQTQLDAINRTLSQFSDIGSARVLIDGVPLSPPATAGTANQLQLDPQSARVPRQFVLAQTGARLYLAAREVAAAQVGTGSAALTERLLDTAYVRELLPRGTEVTWADTPATESRSVAVTIRLRRAKLTERDWQTVQIAADAIALTLRTIPGTAAIQVTVAGQERVFTYDGPIWPNPEPTVTD